MTKEQLDKFLTELHELETKHGIYISAHSDDYYNIDLDGELVYGHSELCLLYTDSEGMKVTSYEVDNDNFWEEKITKR